MNNLNGRCLIFLICMYAFPPLKQYNNKLKVQIKLYMNHTVTSILMIQNHRFKLLKWNNKPNCRMFLLSDTESMYREGEKA